ncbi:MAG: gliding motility-associated C-terminal domain-containing protein [Bacteroidota bacterium]
MTDANGCSISLNTTISEPTLLTVIITASVDVSCNGAGDGSATLTASGGTPLYTYSWNTIPPQSTATANSLTPGTYTVTVTDANGCDTTANITITEPSLLEAIITDSANVGCKGDSTGTATVTVSGGTTSYTYSWNTSSLQTGSTATGLPTGSYNVTVTDANGCETTASVFINEPPLLTISISSIVNISCNGAGDGEATVVAAGGMPPYSYVWNTTPFQSTVTVTGLFPGDYAITVADINGCAISDTVTITQPQVLTASISSIIHVDCYGGNNGAATVVPAGGTLSYTYLWDDSQAQTTATATGLIAGTYMVIISDSNGCTTSIDAIVINQPFSPLVADITDSSDVGCNGVDDGQATVSASGGTPLYTYSWNTIPAQTAPTATGLIAGIYIVTVTDANGCDTTASVNINEPVILNANIISSTNVGCNGDNTGEATVTGSGGIPPYTYSWNTIPAQTDSVATALTSGTYVATVTDMNNCVATTSVTITEPDPLLLTVSEVPANCGSADGEASVIVSGGTLPYTYSWNSFPVQTTDTAAGLPSGIYTVFVIDSNNCTDSANALIGDLEVTVTLDSLKNVTCNKGNDGYASVTVSGGTPPYTYSWNTTPVQTDSFATGLSAGSYYVTATDLSGCQFTLAITINEPDPIIDSMFKADISCNGYNDGSATVTTSGGTPPYTYQWDNGDSTDALQGVSAGIYIITVTDNNGCDTSVNVEITEPDVMTATITGITGVSCNGFCDGTASVTGSGGNPPYGYSWNTAPIKTDPIATGLCAGDYTVTLMDMKGCMATADTTIGQPDTLAASITNVQNVSCNGANDGSATVTASGGTLPYSYIWNTTPFQTDSTATGLEPTSYTVTVIDTNGCITDAGVTITQPDVFTASSGGVIHVTCNGGNDGSAALTASGGTLSYSYLWDTSPVQTDSIATGLLAGTYTAAITDSSGCADSVSVTINEPDLLTANITDSTNVSCNGGNDGEATVTAGGGSPAYTYSWNTSPVQTSVTVTGLFAGIYTVTITDNMGCSATDSVTITEPPLLIASITDSTNVSCYGGSDGSALLTASGGTAPYSYLWNDDSTQITNTATGLSAGTYTVIITDTLGCNTSAIITITEPDILIATITNITNVNCSGDSTGIATVSTTGGTSPYTYLWNTSPVQTDPVATGLPAGMYTITVTDTLGCDTTVNVTIIEADTLIANITDVTNVFCNGDSTGSATVSVSGGASPLSYVWNTIPVQTDSVATSLAMGTYNVTVTDTLGCDTTVSLIITEPPGIVITTAEDTLICVGMSAVISAYAAGGTGGFNYVWSDSSISGTGPDTVYPVTPTTYIVTVTDSLGCTKTDSVTVTVNPFLIIFTVPDSVCVGDSTTIGAIVTGGDGNYFYSWNTGDTTQSITVYPYLATTYILTVNDGCGTPTAIDSVIVDVHPYPVISVKPLFASGCEHATITFVDTAADIFNSTYIWDFGDGSPPDTIQNQFVANHTFENAGTFNVSVTVISPQGCTSYSSNNNTIIISPFPQADFEANPDVATILYPTINFTDMTPVGDGILYWQWDFYYPASGMGDSASNVQHPSHTYPEVGSTGCGYCYSVQLIVINKYGCPDTIVKPVIVKPDVRIWIPNTFSPNNDGINDLFTIKGVEIVDFEMYIYNRWGDEIFETNSIHIPWDGTANGGTLISQQEVYVYIISVTDIFNEEHEFVGHVTLIR